MDGMLSVDFAIALPGSIQRHFRLNLGLGRSTGESHT